MDGLLIDSEPLWLKAKEVTQKKFGIKTSDEVNEQSIGLRPDEVVKLWHHHSPWEKPSQKKVYKAFIDKVYELMEQKDVALPGAHEAVELVIDAGLPVALASNSPYKIIHLELEKLNIKDKIDVIYSGYKEPFGKPHPGIYITAAKKLKIRPELCLAFEDSPNGIIAAKAARMRCIAVPNKKVKDSPVFEVADKVLDSLLDFNKTVLEELK